MQSGEAGVLLGVDYGTSNTGAALRWPDGRVRPLLFDGSPLLPSAVYRNPDGRLLAGRDAVHSARLDPACYEPNPKLRVDDGAVLLGQAEVPVVELVAATLRLVAAEARRAAGSSPGAVTLTYPAAWAAARRGVLREAAALAGLGALRLVPEPVAAAAYFTAVLGHRVAPGQHLVVYDLGAGTFDVSAVQRTADGYQVVDVDGLPTFGGLDLDAAVVHRVGVAVAATEPEAWRRLTKPAEASDRRAFRALWDDARTAKEMLSRHSAAGLFIPLVERDVQVSREEFEAEAGPRLTKAAQLTAALIERAGIGPDQLAGIFLVGGSSRVPLVATTVHRATRVAPDTLEQPETVVAEGALHATPRPSVAAPADSVPEASHATAPAPPDQPATGFPPFQPYEPAPVEQPPTLGPAWALLACAPVVAVVAWLVILTEDAFEVGIPASIAAVLAVVTTATVMLARSAREQRPTPGAGFPTHRREMLVTGAVTLPLVGAVASLAVGHLIAWVLLGADLTWDTMPQGTKIAVVLCPPTAIVSGIAIWLIHRGTQPGPPDEPTAAEPRPMLWPALALLGCAPFTAVVARLVVLTGDHYADWPLVAGLSAVLAMVATAARMLARRFVGQRPAPRQGLVVTGAVLLTVFGSAASHEFGQVALAPLLVERGMIVGPPILTFLVLTTLAAGAVGVIGLGAQPRQSGHPTTYR